MTVDQLDFFLLVGAGILLVAISAVRLSYRTGLPFLVFYVGLGVLLGPHGPTGIHLGVSDPATARVLGYAALVIILAEGGLSTRWNHIRPVLAPAALLATVGVIASATLTATVAVLALGFDWRTAFLLGAILAPTDSAAVFAVLRRVPLPHRLSGMLEAESGGNDASAVLLVVALSTSAHLDGGHLGLLAAEVALELIIGLAVGAAAGLLGAAGLRRVALASAGLYPIAVLALCLLSYAGAARIHGSGFLAVYVAAVILGNARLPHRPPVRAFVEGLAWLSQIGLFVMLGLLVNPADLPESLLPALIIGAGLLLVARPLSTAVCLLPCRVGWRDQVFVSWAGLRGAVPVVLALIPVVAGLPDANTLFHIVFMLVVVFTVLQSPTLGWVAARLRLADPDKTHALEVESLPLVRIGAELLAVSIPPGSQLNGMEIFELRLPDKVAVSLVVREDKVLVPELRTLVRSGDELLIIAPSSAIAATEKRLQVLATQGRLGRWKEDRTGRTPGRASG